MSQTSSRHCVADTDRHNEDIRLRIENFNSVNGQEGVDVHKTDIFKEICRKYLPVLTTEDLEEKVFCKIVPQVQDMFVLLISKIKDNLSKNTVNEEEAINAIIDMLCCILECFEVCVDHVAVDTFVPAKNIYSLSPSVLTVIHESYSHCKDSVIIYGPVLDAFSGPLGEMFEKAQSLLKALLNILDRLEVSPDIADDMFLLTSNLELIGKLGSLAYEIDLKMMASLLKSYLKLAVKYVDDIKNHLDVSYCITMLSDIILKECVKLEGSEECNDENEKLLIQTTRICGFSLKILIKLCEKYTGYLGNCCEKLVKLVFKMYRIFPPSLQAPSLTKNVFDEIESNLVLGLNPLLKYLCSDREFIHFLLSAPVLEWHFEILSVLASVLGVLPHFNDSMYKLWMTSNNSQPSILDKLFESLPLSHVELTLPCCFPGVVCQEKPPRNVSFYEHICTRLCSFVAGYPEDIFYKLENTLLQNLFSTDYWNRLLACDVWAFLARFGSAQLCYSHCSFLAEILLSYEVPVSQSVYVKTLLQRMTTFLAEEHMEAFISKYYSVIGLPGLLRYHSNLFKQSPLADIFFRRYKEALQGFKASINSNSTTDFRVLDILLDLTLVNLMLNRELLTRNDGEIISLLSLLWNSVGMAEPSTFPEATDIIAKVIQLTSFVLPFLDSRLTLQFVRSLTMMSEEQNDLISYRITSCVFKLRKRFFNTPEKKEIMGAIADLFERLLEDPNWLVFHRTLEYFTKFAHESEHTELISEVLERKPFCQDLVTAYLNKTPFGRPTSTSLMITFLRKEGDVLIGNRPSEDVCFNVSKPVKRPRPRSIESSPVEKEDDITELDDCIADIKSNMKRLKALTSKGKLSKVASKCLQSVRTQISDLLEYS